MKNAQVEPSARGRALRALSVLAASAAALAITAVAGAPGARSRGRALARRTPALLSAPLADAPGKNLVVVPLTFAPKQGPASTPEHHPRGHHHPGSVYVYVTEGTVRLGVEGQPVQIVKAGGSFFEPVGAHHIIAESASATEPARAIAVMIVPDGQPLVTLDPE